MAEITPPHNSNRAARTGFRRAPKTLGGWRPRKIRFGESSVPAFTYSRDVVEGSTVSAKCEFATLALLILAAPSGRRPCGVVITKFNSVSAKRALQLPAYEDMNRAYS